MAGPPGVELPRPLKLAYAWRALALLVLRHGGERRLRIVKTFEAHSGRLSLLDVQRNRMPIVLNPWGSAAVATPLYGRPRPHDTLQGERPGDDIFQFPMFAASRGARALADRIEAMAGLPPVGDVPMRPDVISLFVLAELFDRRALRPDMPRLENGCSEARTSDQRESDSDDPAEVDPASRFWSVRGTHGAISVEIATGHCYAAGQHLGSIAKDWQVGESLRTLAWRIEGIVWG